MKKETQRRITTNNIRTMNNEEFVNEESNKSQCKKILERLKKGFAITQEEAAKKPIYCWRLSARIHDLRHKQGYNIITEKVTRNGKHFAQYRLAL